MKIVLICNAGMSTSMLVQKMRAEAEKKGIACTIEAHSVTEAEGQKDASVVLLGPQIRYELERIKTLLMPIPVLCIDSVAYGMMDANKVLNQAMEAVH